MLTSSPVVRHGNFWPETIKTIYMEKYFQIAAMSLCILLGCGNLEQGEPIEETAFDSGKNCARVEVSFSAMEPHVKSVLLPESSAESIVTDITVAAYNGNLLGTWHLDDASSCVLTVPLNVKTFYFTANMGDMSSSFPENEDAVRGLSYRIADFDELSEKGIPMCSRVDWDGNPSLHVALERLFAKIRVTIVKDDSFINPDNGKNTFFLQNIYVRNANTLLLPFGDSAAADAADVTGQSDCQGSFGAFVEQSETDSFTAEFYVPENMMGTLLPGNDDPWKKTSENLVSAGNDFSGKCTYIEIGAVCTYPIKGWVGNVKYKFFIGKDNVSNFDVCRNSVYEITVMPDYDNVMRPSWKVEFSGSDLRSLSFRGAKEVRDGVPVYYFLTGNKNRVYAFYHRTTSGAASSQTEFYKVDWDYCSSVGALVERGVASSVKYDIGAIPGSRGEVMHVVEYDIPETAATGTYSISAETYDGRKKAVANIVVTDSVEWPMNLKWDIIPSYVGQYGKLSIGDVPEEVWPVSYVKSETKYNSSESGEVVRIVPLNEAGTEFKIVACRQGRSVITFANKDGGQRSEVVVNVRRPGLAVDRNVPVCKLDVVGNEVNVPYSIVDENNNAVPNLDENAVLEYLAPVMIAQEPALSYLGMDVKPGEMSMDVYVCHVDDDMIRHEGGVFPVDLNFRDCAGEAFSGFKVMFTFPVKEDRDTGLGRIDDYSLLTYRPLRKQFCLENDISYTGNDIYCTEPGRYEFDYKSIYIGNKVAQSSLPVSSVTVDDITRQPYPGASRLHTTSYAFRGSWMRYELAEGGTQLKFWPVYYHKIQDLLHGVYEYDKEFGRNEEGFDMYSHVAGKKYVRFNYVNRHSNETIGIAQGYINFYVYGQLAWKRREGAFEFQKPNGRGVSGAGYVINGNIQQYYPFFFSSAEGYPLPAAGNVPCGLYPLFAYYECIGDIQSDTYSGGAYYSLPMMELKLRSKDNFFTDLGIGDFYSVFTRWVYYDMSLVFAVHYTTTDKFNDMMSSSSQIGTDCTGMYDAVYSEVMSGTPEGALSDGADVGCARTSSGMVAFGSSDNNARIVISNVLKSRHGNAMRLQGGCEKYDPSVGQYSRKGINNMLYRVIGFPGLDYEFILSNGKKSHAAAPGVYNNVLPALFKYDNPGIMSRMNSSGTGKYEERDAEGKSYYQIVSILDR